VKTLIIYDSVFGNTEKVAKAISKAFAKEVEIAKVSEVKIEQLCGLNLLIVGSPTRAFRPTKELTAFLREIPENSLKKVRIAAFDTRVDVKELNNKLLTNMVKFLGYAAKPIANLLSQKGGKQVIDPEGFIVLGEKGPLKEGEVERVKTWVENIKSKLL